MPCPAARAPFLAELRSSRGPPFYGVIAMIDGEDLLPINPDVHFRLIPLRQPESVYLLILPDKLRSFDPERQPGVQLSVGRAHAVRPCVRVSEEGIVPDLIAIDQVREYLLFDNSVLTRFGPFGLALNGLLGADRYTRQNQSQDGSRIPRTPFCNGTH
jgi:hypothetical protein